MTPKKSDHTALLFALAALLSTAGCRGGLFHLAEGGSVTAQDAWDDARQAHTGGQRIREVSFWSEHSFIPGVSEGLHPELGGGWRAYQRLALLPERVAMVALHNRTRISWALDDGKLTTLKQGYPYKPMGPVGAEKHLRGLRHYVLPWEPTTSSNVDVQWMEPRNGLLRVHIRELNGSCATHILELDPDSRLVMAAEHREGRLPLVTRLEFSDFRTGPAGVTLAQRVTQQVRMGPAMVPVEDVTLGTVEWNIEPALPATVPAFP